MVRSLCVHLSLTLLTVLGHECGQEPPTKSPLQRQQKAVDTQSRIAPPGFAEAKVSPIFTEPNRKSKARGTTIWTIQSIPNPSDISCLIILPPEPADRGGSKLNDLTEKSVREILKSAVPLAVDDAAIDEPLVFGSRQILFRYGGNPWVVAFRSNGIGFITGTEQNERRTGAFRFNLETLLAESTAAAPKQKLTRIEKGPEPPVLIEPSHTSKKPWDRTLWTINHLPGPQEVSCVFVIQADSTELNIMPIDEDFVLDAIRNARPLAADNDTVDNWHYAVGGGSALFRYDSRLWSVSLHPGGLGFITDHEAGRTGAFLFRPKRSDKKKAN